MRGFHPAALACLRAAELLATTALAVRAAQALSQRRLLANDGMAAWRGHAHPRIARLLRISRVDAIFQYPATVAVLWLQLLCALLVFTCVVTGHTPRLPLVALVLLSLIWHLRLPLSLDGSDQFACLTLIASAVAEFLHSPTATLIALTFLAAQAALAYGTAGFLKLKEKGWYDGSHMSHVLSTATYGDGGLWSFFRAHGGLARMSGTLFVLCECLLPFAALLPPPACALVLCSGVVLHAVIARVLGLNTFLWAYSASYPATFYLSTRLYAA